MSRKGNPYDNAACESFMKTLKYEEVYRQEYRDLGEAQTSIEHVPRKRSITKNGCTRRSATARRWNSRQSLRVAGPPEAPKMKPSYAFS